MAKKGVADLDEIAEKFIDGTLYERLETDATEETLPVVNTCVTGVGVVTIGAGEGKVEVGVVTTVVGTEAGVIATELGAVIRDA